MDLFDYMKSLNKQEEPLASRMRPTTIDEIVGQKHILGKNKLLRRMIEADRLRSIILYGPPGTGKTSIANVIANTTKSKFVPINATNSGKKEMSDVIEQAIHEKRSTGKKTILFIDEIHRFNKAQQDYLLPFIENGTVILIGATTENPYFEINKALISRSNVFELYPLTEDEIKQYLMKSLTNKEKGMGNYNAEITDDALNYLTVITGGDLREALNALELAVLTTKEREGKITLDLDVIRECVQKRTTKYDKDSDSHYDTISAFIKSMRGSDPDATLYYLARMLYAGEDIKFIARRIMICAAEDVGLADPNALIVATNASLVVERLGMPEARIPLAEAALYVAKAKKDNSAYLAIDKALDFVKNHPDYDIPNYLKDMHYKDANKLNHGIGYKYPHNYPGHFVEQQYLPDKIKNEKFYIEN